MKNYRFCCSTDLESITTSNGSVANGDTKHAFFGKLGTPAEVALKADSLCKTYDGVHDAVKDVTFSVKSGEVNFQSKPVFSNSQFNWFDQCYQMDLDLNTKICKEKIQKNLNYRISLQCFGLLGSNGAGKSTIFSMLSGEMAPTSGTVSILNRDDGVAYCPQSNALDALLTVEEIMYFYGKLRRISNIQEVILKSVTNMRNDNCKILSDFNKMIIFFRLLIKH